MQLLRMTFFVGLINAASSLPSVAQEALQPEQAPATIEDTSAAGGPTGTFVDEFGTSFSFSLCGDDGTALCGVLNTLQGESATEENLAFVGTQVMQAEPSGPNQWKGAIAAGGISAEATITQVGPDTIDIEGCRAILCQTLSYTRVTVAPS